MFYATAGRLQFGYKGFFVEAEKFCSTKHNMPHLTSANHFGASGLTLTTREAPHMCLCYFIKHQFMLEKVKEQVDRLLLHFGNAGGIKPINSKTL